MATKNFIVSFEGDSKTIYRSLLQNFISVLLQEIFSPKSTVRHLGLTFHLINNVLVTSQQG